MEDNKSGETEPFVQAVEDALEKKYDNIVALCSAEIEKSGIKMVNNTYLANCPWLLWSYKI